MSCNVPGAIYSEPGALMLGKTILRNELTLSGDQIFVAMRIIVVTAVDVSREFGTDARV